MTYARRTLKDTLENALDTASLSLAAESVIRTLCADCRIDEETRPEDLLHVLEDGAALAELGLNDEKATEEAYSLLNALDSLECFLGYELDGLSEYELREAGGVAAYGESDGFTAYAETEPLAAYAPARLEEAETLEELRTLADESIAPALVRAAVVKGSKGDAWNLFHERR